MAVERIEFLRSQVCPHGWSGYPARVAGAYCIRDGRDIDSFLYDAMLDSRAETRSTLSRMGAHKSALKMPTISQIRIIGAGRL